MVKEIIVVHIPFKMGYRASGGGMRPQKMVSAFKREGLDVEVIEGDHPQRNRMFQNLLKRVESNELKIRFIYSESSANPTIFTDRKNWFLFRDFFYLRKLHKRGVPVGLFYRDVHWNFEIAQKKANFLKQNLLKFFHYLDLVLYLTFVDMLYLPSKQMKEFVPLSKYFKAVDELPPGHDVHESVPSRSMNDFPKMIYVGGVLPPVYDITPILEDFGNQNLTICCRKDEWEVQKHSYERLIEARTKVVHLQGEELRAELLNNHISLIVRTNHSYLSFSQPLKFFEAIGFELPLVVTEGSLVADLVKKWDIGWVCKDGADGLEFTSYQQKLANISKVKPLHTWDARARKVVDDLSKV